MGKVYDIDKVMELFIFQQAEEAMTPLCEIRGIGKSRRFYFKGDTAYSYGVHFPIAKMREGVLFLKAKGPSRTTVKHIRMLAGLAKCCEIKVIYSDDLESARTFDDSIQMYLNKFLNARTRGRFYIRYVLKLGEDKQYPITKSRFPLLFDEKHEKLRTMMLSKDKEIVDLVKKIIRKEKLI